MRITLVVAFVLSAALLVFPQHPKASAEGQRLVKAFNDLQATPGSPRAQKAYLAAFPHDYRGFLALFEPGRELYDGHEYIPVLTSLAKTHEREVGGLLVGLAKDAKYDADAPAYLQNETIGFAANHTHAFIREIHRLPQTKQQALITFLADVENHGAYPAYQTAIDELRRLGEKRLVAMFETAREARMRQPHE